MLGLDVILCAATPVAVIVNDSIYPFIQEQIDTLYLPDLRAEGFEPLVFTFSADADANALRGLLRALHEDQNIEGVILIGRLPVALCAIQTESYPADLYFYDLDGIWIDRDVDGLFDDYIGDSKPEIWGGRLACDNLTIFGMDEAGLLNSYFAKDHAYRTGTISAALSDEALVYCEYFNDYDHLELKDQIDNAYWRTRDIWQDDSTYADDYAQKLTEGYELVLVSAHGTSQTHEFWYQGNPSTFHSYQLPGIDPPSFFIMAVGCGNARFVDTNYIAGCYVFNPESPTLWCTGGTIGYPAWHHEQVMRSLQNFQTIGEACKEWYSVEWPAYWHTAMIVLIGDPTLRLRREMARGEVLFYDQGGDLDLTPDPGETLQVYVKLRNQTESQTISGITATLSGGDTLITILDSTAPYGDFSPGEERINSAPFRIAISPSAPRGLRIPIDLRIISTGGREWFTGFYLNIGKPFIAYSWQRWDDPDGNLDPGETSPLYVQLYYDTLWASWGGLDTCQMHICATGVTGVLRSLDTALTVTDSTASYGIISWGMRAWPTDPFKVRASSGIAQSPYVALLELEIRTNESSPKKDTFSVTVGDYEFFYDDFEEGAKGWLHEPITPGWHDEWHLEDYRHNSGEWSWKCGGPEDSTYLEDGCLLMSSPVLVRENWVCSAWFYVDVDPGRGNPAVYGAGGWLEANDGTGWYKIPPSDNYDSYIYIPDNMWGFCPQKGIGGEDRGWFSLVFPLAVSKDGGQMAFRLLFFSGGGMSFYEGLYIDDFYVGPVTGITEKARAPGLSLSVSPNPAKGQVKIIFTLPGEGPYSLRVYDPAGRMVRDLGQGRIGGQAHGVAPTGLLWVPDVPSGVYFLRLEAGGKALTEKVVIK